MGGTQDPGAPQAAPPSSGPASSAAPAGPNALDTLMASMSRAELLVLAGGALLIVLDVIGWFVAGFGVNNVALGFGVLGVALVVMRKSLPSGVSGIYWGLLAAVALVAGVMLARSVILEVLFIAQPPAGASPARLLNLVGLLAAAAAMGWAALLMWRNRA